MYVANRSQSLHFQDSVLNGSDFYVVQYICILIMHLCVERLCCHKFQIFKRSYIMSGSFLTDLQLCFARKAHRSKLRFIYKKYRLRLLPKFQLKNMSPFGTLPPQIIHLISCSSLLSAFKAVSTRRCCRIHVTTGCPITDDLESS